MLHGGCFGEEAGARKFVLFRVKWLQALVWEAVAGTLVLTCFFCRTVTVASSCFGCGCVCVRSSMRLWSLWLQIALESLHLIVVKLLCMRNLRAFWNAWLQIAVGIAASKFLPRAAAFVILLFYAAESCESYWSGCIKVAIMISQISPFFGW